MLGVTAARLGLLGLILTGSSAFAAQCALDKVVPDLDMREPSLVMLLSPRMPYAVLEWARLKAVAERTGFRVHVLRDARVPDSEWMEAARATQQAPLRQIPAMPESVAASCGLLNHFPATLVLGHGCLHPWPVLGVMPDAQWSSVLRHRLSALQEMGCQAN